MALSRSENELIERDADALREKIFEEAQCCATCMPWEDGEAVWLTTPHPLQYIIQSALESWGKIKRKQHLRSDEVLEVARKLELDCPGCGVRWDGTEEVGGPNEPIELSSFAVPKPRVKAARKKIIVAFGDIISFSTWLKRPTLTQTALRNAMTDIYAEFSTLRLDKSYFAKLLGDGVMFVKELSDDATAPEVAEIFLRDTLELIKRMRSLILQWPSPRPGGFRARITLGEVCRLRVYNPKNPNRFRLDYIGYPVNLASRLLEVSPETPLIFSEPVKELLGGKLCDSARMVRLEPPAAAPKGVDSEDIKTLWYLDR